MAGVVDGLSCILGRACLHAAYTGAMAAGLVANLLYQELEKLRSGSKRQESWGAMLLGTYPKLCTIARARGKSGKQCGMWGTGEVSSVGCVYALYSPLSHQSWNLQC